MTVLVEALGAVQRFGGEALLGLVAGDQRMASDELANSEDEGLFGPASIAWRVHSDPAMFIGGVRSLLFQSLHPLAMAGVDQHSDYRDDPWGRLNRTSRFVAATTFGSTAAAHEMIDTVTRVHQRVEGVDRRGIAYSASDPRLLLWVHVAQVDSFLAGFNRYGTGKLTDGEQDRYVAEMARPARLLGAADVPETVAELNGSLESFRRELLSTPEAREAVRFLAFPPDLALAARAPYGMVFAAAAASLPGFAQRLLRLPVPPLAGPLFVAPAATSLTRALGWFMAGTGNADKRAEKLHRR